MTILLPIIVSLNLVMSTIVSVKVIAVGWFVDSNTNCSVLIKVKPPSKNISNSVAPLTFTIFLAVNLYSPGVCGLSGRRFMSFLGG